MYKLYPHNQKVYDMVLSYFEEAHKVAVIQATGTGKGVLAGAFVNSAFKGKRILLAEENELNAENIIPKAFDLKVQKLVAEAVKEAAIKSGVAQI